MTRLTHAQLAILAGLEILPAILLVALGHPLLGAAALVAVLVVYAALSWMIVRSERDWRRAILSYAQDNTYMGRDPTKVVTALHAAAAGVIIEPQGQGHDQRGNRRSRTW